MRPHLKTCIFSVLLLMSRTANSQSLPIVGSIDSNRASKSNVVVEDKRDSLAKAKFRADEWNRRAIDPGRPAPRNGQSPIRAEFADIVGGKELLSQEDVCGVMNAKPMPRTQCKSVAEVAIDSKDEMRGPWRAHQLTIDLFTNQSGFGYIRMLSSENERGKQMASPGIDRVELVSLLNKDEPSVYVLDRIPIPSAMRLARRRPLDEFEELGLDAVRRGSELVWTQESPNRMFGAIRASESCLECHTGAKEKDLLGAFTYYLETSMDKLGQSDRR